MDRHLLRLCSSFALVVLCACQLGCTSALFTAAYMLKGTEVDPEYDGLRGKRVAVVCRPMIELRYAHGNVASQIADQLGRQMKRKIRRLELIDQDRIAEWVDANEWDEFKELGEAVGADMVVGIELEQFEILRGQTLYQGTATVVVSVYDMKNGGELVFQRHMPQFNYPPNTGIPTSDMPQDQFRRMFVSVLADQIGRYFYRYDPHKDFARDADTL